MGIGYSTLQTWKKKYQDIQDSLKKGKEVVDILVENALLKRALGYEYEEVTRERRVNPQTGEVGLVVVKIVKKEVVPDTTAQIFWLKNRKPEEWRDVNRTEISGSLETGGKNPFEGISTDDIKALIKNANKK